MPTARVNGVTLYYEEAGAGLPLVFVHEFAGDHRSWQLQVRFFSRRYRAIAFNARGYPPSDVPEDPGAYSQDHAGEDIRGLLDALKLPKAHVRALSLVVAGAGYGSVPGDRAKFHRDAELTARRFEEDGMAKTAGLYAKGPTRV
jgi:pimeloyl-ACP methyl ester carboxylesterase